MDELRLKEMGLLLNKHLGPLCGEPLVILDVGAYDVNGTHRPAMPPAWTYIGSDIRPGPNVDIVQASPYVIQDEGGVFDAVLCSATLEHVGRPWRLVPEMARMLCPQGYLFVGVPWRWERHEHPADYWRILCGGLVILFEDAGLDTVEVYDKDDFTWGVARAR